MRSLFADFIGKDGLELQRRWAIPAFHSACKSYELSEDIIKFLRQVAGYLIMEDFRKPVDVVVGHFPVAVAQFLECVVARLQAFCEMRPTFRKALLAKASLVRQVHSNVSAISGRNTRHCFRREGPIQWSENLASARPLFNSEEEIMHGYHFNSNGRK
jgi:hypothetical protein